jgi:hypothetical protein
MKSETSNPIIRSKHFLQVFVMHVPIGTKEHSYWSVVQYDWNDLDCVSEIFRMYPLDGFLRGS